MKFGEKLKRAIKKIKGKIIVFGILTLVILVWGVAPMVRAYVNGVWTTYSRGLSGDRI